MESKPVRNILIGCSGSVACIKLPNLVTELLSKQETFQYEIKIIATQRALHFINREEINHKVEIITDEVEWSSWQKRGDPVMHIDLGKWADIMVIAPLDANTLAKIATGLCDNLLTCTIRAWDLIKKPIYFCPAMNTRMYDHPITETQINVLKGWGFREIPCILKTLMCGDTGNGAMAEVPTIVMHITTDLK